MTSISIDVFLDLLVYPTEEFPVHVDAGSTLTQLASFKIVNWVYLYLILRERTDKKTMFTTKRHRKPLKGKNLWGVLPVLEQGNYNGQFAFPNRLTVTHC